MLWLVRSTQYVREPATLKQMMVTESSEMLSWLQRAARNGTLRFV